MFGNIYAQLYRVCKHTEKDKSPFFPMQIRMKSNKIDVVSGKECRRIHRAMPLNLSARILHSVIGNHYAHFLEVALYFE